MRFPKSPGLRSRSLPGLSLEDKLEDLNSHYERDFKKATKNLEEDVVNIKNLVDNIDTTKLDLGDNMVTFFEGYSEIVNSPNFTEIEDIEDKIQIIKDSVLGFFKNVESDKIEEGIREGLIENLAKFYVDFEIFHKASDALFTHLPAIRLYNPKTDQKEIKEYFKYLEEENKEIDYYKSWASINRQKSKIRDNIIMTTPPTSRHSSSAAPGSSAPKPKTPEQIEREEKAQIVNIAGKIAYGKTLNAKEEEIRDKYPALLKDELAKFGNPEKIIEEIAQMKIDGKHLTPEQLAFMIVYDKAEDKVEEKKRELEAEKTAELAKQNFIIDELTNGKDVTSLSDEDQEFYNKFKTTIDTKVQKNKDEAKRLKEESERQSVIDKTIAGTPLSAEEQIVYERDKAVFDTKILDGLKTNLQDAEASGNIILADEIKEKIESRTKTLVNAKIKSEALTTKLKAIYNSDQYKKILAKTTPTPEELRLMQEYQKEIQEINNDLDKLGPAGKLYATLDIERENLAKDSQEFSKSFEKKFFGAKVVGVFAGMFGSKWSAMKEGKNTKSAQEKMNSSKIRYDETVRELLNVGVSEEVLTRKSFGQDLKNLSSYEQYKLKIDVAKLDHEFIHSEREKLNELKHTLESTVRGSAMRQFGDMYSKMFMVGPLKDNIRARNVAKRIVSGGILTGALFSVGAVVGAPITAGMLGYSLTRAAISGTIGESFAAGVSGIFGGKMNEKGEFVKYAEARDEELNQLSLNWIDKTVAEIQTAENPKISLAQIEEIRKGENRAVSNYMNKQGNLRRAEMWTRIIAGGATSFALHEVLANPDFTPIQDSPDAGKVVPGPAPITAPVPPAEDFLLVGDSVEASSKGFIKTFMDLKKEMLDHYKGLDETFPYGDKADFANLTDDQIVAKLVETGKFNDLTKDILEAKTLPEFMKVAEEHGFYKPEGWGNSTIESASVPKGSIVGMETDPTGNMRLFMQLPNGTKIPLDDNFQEALAKNLKGVQLINGDQFLENSKVLTPPQQGGVTNLDDRPPEDDLTNFDPYLDGSEYGPTQADGNGAVSPDPAVGEGAQAPDPDVIRKGGPNPDNYNITEGVGDPETITQITKRIQELKSSMQAPGNLYEEFKQAGFETKGKMGMPLSDNTITEYYHPQTGQSYYTEHYSGYDSIRGTAQDIQNSPIFQEYLIEKNIFDQNNLEIAKLEALKYKLEAEQFIANQGDLYNQETSEVLTAEQLKATQENIEEIKTNWIDDAFTKNGWFKDTPGTETKAWEEFKEKDISEMLKDAKRSPFRGDEDFYSKSLSKDENAFMNEILKEAKYNGEIPTRLETVEEFIDRLAKKIVMKERLYN